MNFDGMTIPELRRQRRQTTFNLKRLDQASRKPRTFHVTMTVDAILRRLPDQLEGIFHNTDDGRPMTGNEVLAMAWHYKAKGYEAIPVCDNHHLGVCQGHEKPKDRTDEPGNTAAFAGANCPTAGLPAVPAGSQADQSRADEPQSRPAGTGGRGDKPACLTEQFEALTARCERLAALLRQCRPVMVSHARASHLVEGFRPKLNRWDALVDDIQGALSEPELVLAIDPGQTEALGRLQKATPSAKSAIPYATVPADDLRALLALVGALAPAATPSLPATCFGDCPSDCDLCLY